jgi:hypothetical protein
MRPMLLAALLLAAPAAASPSSDAFTAGKFAEAAAAGRREGTAQSLLTAGRAAATQAAWQTSDRESARRLLAQAEADLSASLALAPGNPAALLQKAMVVGFQAKLAKSPGLAKQARAGFEAVLAKQPGSAPAQGAMGGWHGEAVATLGKFLAGTARGAKEGEAISWFDRAVATTGGDPAIPLFYATTLLGLSTDNAAKAKALLQRAVKAAPADGFDRLMQANARAILAPLDKGDVKAAQAMAKRLAPLGSAR